jgi:hypothetical protein
MNSTSCPEKWSHPTTSFFVMRIFAALLGDVKGQKPCM